MTHDEKKIAVFKWLALSGYPVTMQTLPHITDRLKKKYPGINWDIELPDVIKESSIGDSPFIAVGDHAVFFFK